MLWLYLIIGVFADTANVFIAKKFVDSNNYYWLIGTVLTVIVLNLAYIMSVKAGELSIITATWLVTVLIGSVLLGYFIFKEDISTLQWLGIILAVVSIILLQWPKS